MYLVMRRRTVNLMLQLVKKILISFILSYQVWSIAAPPSLKPKPKYCDITGLIAPYTEPQSKLRYHNTDCYQYIRSLPEHTVYKYIELRNDHVIMK